MLSGVTGKAAKALCPSIRGVVLKASAIKCICACLLVLLLGLAQKAVAQGSKTTSSTSNLRQKINERPSGRTSGSFSNNKVKKTASLTSTSRTFQVPSKGKKEGRLIGEPYKAAVVMDAATGEVLFSRDAYKPLVPASLTKMMLVLIVMEKVKAGHLRLYEPVVVTERTTSVGGTQVDLKPGEVLPLEDMLMAILIRSANDAAATLAEHVAGSEARFVELMNQKAQSLGMRDTSFVNVHGLPGQNGRENVSTAYDMAILARALLSHPEVLRWSSQSVAFIRNGRYLLHSTNKLLGQCEGVDGLKTGFTRKAGFNIAATAIRNGKRLVVVVMGSPSSKVRNEATATLLANAFGPHPHNEKSLATRGNQKPVISRSISRHNGAGHRRGG